MENTNVKTIDAPVDGDVIPLSDILVDTKYHSRRGMNQAMIARYETVYRTEIREGIEESRMPPLEVAFINGVCVLFDGFLRYRAMKNCGVLSAAVNVHHGRSYKELPYLASRLNLLHGLPMTKGETRKIVFRSYVESGMNRDRKRYKSYREIAEDFGFCQSYTTFRNWMEKDFPAVFKAMGKDDPEGHIEFEPLDPDEENKEAAIEDLDRFTNRYHSIKSDETKGWLCHILKGEVEKMESGIPRACVWNDDDSEF